MKTFLFATALLLLCQCAEKNSGSNDFEKEFFRNYSHLDSINKNAAFDTTCLSSVKYMEHITGIKATQDGNFLGPTLFTAQDLEAWKKWYDDNHK